MKFYAGTIAIELTSSGLIQSVALPDISEIFLRQMMLIRLIIRIAARVVGMESKYFEYFLTGKSFIDSTTSIHHRLKHAYLELKIIFSLKRRAGNG